MAGRRRALIVANGEYDNAGLQRLGSPAADADALAGVLADRAISDFAVSVVRNETAHVVQAEIEDLCLEGKPDDVLLLHFSCHGLKDDAGGLYFAARNTRPDRLRSTAVSAEFVQQCIRQSRSRSIVLLLDCCYGGAFSQGVAVRASGEANVLDSFRGGRGRAVITASNSIEYAFEGATLASDGPAQPSVFTAALVEGLRTGEADRDEDGWIALGELYEYLFDRVRERNPKQTPSRDIEMQGELYLAKSRRRRIKPSPIPPDLAAAIGAENPFTRLGAVAELRRRLSSANLPVAVGAFEALRAMASTDIEHVAAAAAEAMSSAVVRVDTPSVRLSAAPGSSASASLRPLGPPVAREVRFEASHSWIAVSEVAGGASLSVTAGEAGERRGKVVVSGPTGETVVAVEIEARPEPVPVPVPVEKGQPDPAPGADVEPEPARETGPEAAEPGRATADAESGPRRRPAPQLVQGPGPAVAAEPVKPPATPGQAEEPVAGAAERGAAAPGGLAGAAAIVSIIGALFALSGLAMPYRYEYSLAEYRPGMPFSVGVVAVCGALAGVVALAPRARGQAGPALLAGVGFAALFGLLRFIGELITLSSSGSETDLQAGFVVEMIAHGGLVTAGVLAVVASARDPRVPFGFGKRPGWEAWAAIALGVVVATGFLLQLSELTEYDSSLGGRAAAYFRLGAVLFVALPAFAAVLRPRRVAAVVLAAGTAGLSGVLAPTFGAIEEYGSKTSLGQAMVVAALVLLVLDAVVLAVRNQPNGRRP
ncbi:MULTISPECIES: caspase, EACC1-associated type [Amycolatopsis]|uniref:Peptidase C14 caspase domain-containing protein n=1 Tax=Amycolatopsis bullii TaxID=941987 RepID=A0ABQ3KHE3_9PSEU|nr:caspase family protein [Amycolatopsis bullii]GHG24969.1 hypothetical protein GCM10017567_50200 [Amycolatopsis bullii]